MIEVKYESGRVVALDRSHAERLLKLAAKQRVKIELVDKNLFFDGGYINERASKGAEGKAPKRSGNKKSE